MRIATLATCHNRRVKTLQALDDLYAQELPVGVEVSHTIVDDGSTDGTDEAVRRAFPNVDIVAGDGGLFWAGGMRHGWEQSVSRKKFDYLLVYNDDVRVAPTALARLLMTGRAFLADGGTPAHVVVGAFSDDEGNTSYGGVVRSSRWHPLRFKKVEPPVEGYVFVHTINMNFCLISKEALERVGFLSHYFQHSGADYEYGLKLRASGGAVLMAPGYVGECQRNSGVGKSMEPRIPLVERYRRLVSVKEQPLGQRFEYYRRHGGLFWPLLFVSPYLSVFLKHFAKIEG